MASRPNRAAPIPIPMPPSGVRSLDNAISIPHRLPSSLSLAMSPPSLVRSVPRASLSSSRGSPRVPYEPRIIRASNPTPTDRCLQPPATTHGRRASASAHPARSATRSSAATQADAPALVVTTDTFPRPAYLDHSTFRGLLHTDPSSPLPRRDAHTPARTPSSSAASTMTPSTDSDDDYSTPPRRATAPTPQPAPAQPQAVFTLPTRWSVTDRSNHLTISPDGRDLTYTGNSDKDGASARTDIPIPPACGIYYYEVEIRGKDQKSHVSIGFAGPKVKFNRLPGWEPFSWGYHGDDGFSFTAERSGNPFSQTYGSSDVVGCGVDFSTHRAFYTKNGVLLGNVFENVGKGIDLYPSVGLQHSGESIRVNFGHEPFRFDIENHVQQQKNVAWNKIMATPLYTSVLNRSSASTSTSKAALSEEESKIVLNKLVLSYLIHHGYSKTVRAFQKQQDIVLKARSTAADDGDVDMDNDAVKENAVEGSLEDDIERRTRVVDAVIRGDIDLAITETEKYHPSVLKAEEGLMLFKLRCRKFVELILQTAAMKRELDAMEERREMHASHSYADGEGFEESMDMDIDDDQIRETSVPQVEPISKGAGKRRAESGLVSAAQYEAALNAAIEYGKALRTDYKADTRPGVQQLLTQTFSIIAFHDPLGQRGEIANFVSADVRTQLAGELNQAILKSQGQPAQPELETLYRRTSACITQLGIFGEGAAGFADLQRELLEA